MCGGSPFKSPQKRVPLASMAMASVGIIPTSMLNQQNTTEGAQV